MPFAAKPQTAIAIERKHVGNSIERSFDAGKGRHPPQNFLKNESAAGSITPVDVIYI